MGIEGFKKIMKKYLALVITATLLQSVAFSQPQEVLSSAEELTVDTIYYNNDWDVVSSKYIADYFRVKVNSKDQVNKQFRDYFITGELQARGGWISMDNVSDKNTIFDGKCTSYHRNGKVNQERNYANRKLNGTFTIYTDDGLINSNVNYIDDKREGIHTEFNGDGLCIQTKYTNGIADNYYTVSNSSGCVMKYDMRTNQPIWESPQYDEKQVEYKDGVAWSYYNKNGLIISVSTAPVKDYGKYHQIKIVIANNSVMPINFDPILAMHATSTNKKQEVSNSLVLSSEEYLKKVKRAQTWQTIAVGLSEGLAAIDAGHSTSTKVTDSHSRATVHAHAHTHSLSGSGGASVSASASQHSHTVTTTKHYDAFAAYQAQVIASNRVASFEKSLLNDRKVKEEGYLKRTTIKPTEIVSGYVNIERDPKDISLTVAIEINGAIYFFNW